VPESAAGFATVETLFGESASRAVISAPPAQAQEVLARAAREGVPARVAGRVGGTRIRLSVGGQVAVDVTVADAEAAWTTAIPRRFERNGQS